MGQVATTSPRGGRLPRGTSATAEMSDIYIDMDCRTRSSKGEDGVRRVPGTGGSASWRHPLSDRMARFAELREIAKFVPTTFVNPIAGVEDSFSVTTRYSQAPHLLWDQPTLSAVLSRQSPADIRFPVERTVPCYASRQLAAARATRTERRIGAHDVPLLHSIDNLYAPTRRYTGDRCQAPSPATRSRRPSKRAARSGWSWSRAWSRWRRRTGTNSGPVWK